MAKDHNKIKSSKTSAPTKDTKSKSAPKTAEKPVPVMLPELVDKVIELAGENADERKIVSSTFEAIKQFNAEGRPVNLIGFGNFEVRKRNARMGRNPQTGASIEIAESKAPALKVGKPYRDAVNGGGKKPDKTSDKGKAKPSSTKVKKRK